MSRFLSVDPLASKYPSLSPYVYVANNPIKYPDGEKIVIPRNGRSAQTLNDLAKIYATPKGKGREEKN